MRKTDTKSRPLRDEQTPLVDARTTLEPSPWWRTLLGRCGEIWRTCSTGCRTLLQCLTEQFNSARTIASGLSRACCDFIGSCRPVVSLARFFSKPEEKASSRLKRLCRNSTRASTGAGLARVAAARRGVRLRPWRAVRQRRREWLWSQSQVGRVLSNTYYALHRFFAPVGPRHSRTRSYGAYRRARDALHACVTPLLRCCFVGLFCGVLSALSPVVGSCAATVASYGVVITASRLAPAAHGPDCRQATILGVVCATAILVSPLAGMGAACFLAVCPTSCLWWPPKESLAKASMAVYVKAVTYKGKPFFFVRMQFGKGSERKELCGPRHVTEEAAKRDKESLDGKPIDEQRAIIQRLKSGEEATPRKRHAKEEATPRKGSLCAQQTVQPGSTAVQVNRGKTEYTPGSGSVDVKAGKSEKHRPFFFVRLRIDGRELCGPRHVTEEAAKRDKESLNGKPIVEQRAIIRRLRSVDKKARRKKARHKAESSSARAARLLKRRRVDKARRDKARRNETAEQKLLRNAAERVRGRRCRNA